MVCLSSDMVLYDIQKRQFIEALCGSFFTKYAHCKPFHPFQNNA